MSIPVYDVIYDNENDGDIYGISPVDKPATQLEFIALSEIETHKIELKSDKKKQIIYGVVLRPNLLIERKDADGLFNLRFTEDVVERIAHDYFKKGYQKNAFFNHELKLDDACVVEQWLVEDPLNDKATAIGLKVMKGDWVIGQKLGDASWKEYIETGKATGFSIDSFLQYERTNMNAVSAPTQSTKKLNINMNLITRVKNFLSEIAGIEDTMITIDVDGKSLSADAFEVGNVVYNDDLTEFVGEFDNEGRHFVTDELGKIITADPIDAEVVEEELEVEVDPAEVDPAEEEVEVIAEEIAEIVAEDVIDVASLETKIAELETLVENLTETNNEVIRENEELKARPTVGKLRALNPISMKALNVNTNSTLSKLEALRKKNNNK